MADIEKFIQDNFKQQCVGIYKIPESGSSRIYYRVQFSDTHTIIVCKGNNLKENEYFIYLSTLFLDKKLPVPAILAHSAHFDIYAIEDAGTTDLLSYKLNNNKEKWLPLYKNALTDLIQFQIRGAENLDFSKSHVRSIFDSVYMQWDLAYFKYYYAKLSDIEIDEQKLEQDFHTIISKALESSPQYFMYRDFQARNIMLYNKSLKYIDYQGGMKGALQYDLVSLLYQAKAQLTADERTELLEYYIQQLSEQIQIDTDKFKELFQVFVCIRILQTLGAYGYRGKIQHKEHFISSIPYALENAKKELQILTDIVKIPYLSQLITQLPVL